MPFIPHTKDDISAMLAEIDVKSVNQLFDEIPAHLHVQQLNLPEGLSELAITRLISDRATEHKPGTCFIGAGAYEHHIPAAVWDIATRGEYYSAYTPYQAEASQGTLQLIYEYQTIMCRLLGMDVSNASMYDGATALVESVLMAVRIKRGKARRVLVPSNIHPIHHKVLQTFLPRQDITIELLPYSEKTGCIEPETLSAIDANDVAAVIIPQPNFFGGIEDADALVAQAKAMQILSIAYVNPLAMSLLKQPGAWNNTGVDIVCGEGQPLGVPLASGGPYFGFMCCRKEHVRQMPGRIVGRTQDEDGKQGFVLTLQAREQHIRRSKATSNICTNQGLMVTAATIHMSMLGARGLYDAAAASHQAAMQLQTEVTKLAGVSTVFDSPKFHEFVIRFDHDATTVLQKMSQRGIQAGYSLQTEFDTLQNCILVCATETKTEQDIKNYVSQLVAVLQEFN